MKAADFKRVIEARLADDPEFYTRKTDHELPAQKRRLPLSAQRRPWRARFRRLMATYDTSKSAANPIAYRAYGAVFPDGQVVLWHQCDGYIDVHKDITAMRTHYLKYGEFSVTFADDVQPVVTQ